MTSPDPRLAALRALAEKATPCEWYARPNFLIGGTWITTDPDNQRDRAVADLIDSDANAEYIAAANPAVVISLLDALAVAEGRLAAAEEIAAIELSNQQQALIDARNHFSDAMRFKNDRDALAARLGAAEARLAGAERVVEAVKSRRMEVPPVVYGAFDEWRREFDNASEAGVVGEGRGT